MQYITKCKHSEGKDGIRGHGRLEVNLKGRSSDKKFLVVSRAYYGCMFNKVKGRRAVVYIQSQ